MKLFTIATATILGAGMSAAQAQSVTVGVFGGQAQAAFTECVFRPFTAKTGTKVVLDIGASAVTLNKLVAQKSAPAMDVAFMDGGPSEQASAAGVLEALDPQRIPNLANVVPQAIHAQGGQTYAAGVLFYSFGLLYNKNTVKEPPKAWADLWSGKYKGQVALPSMQISMGLPFLAHMATIGGGSMTDLKPALENLRKVDAVAFFASAGNISSMFQAEEVAVAPHFSTSALELIKAGAPLAFIAPTDKPIANDSRVHLVRNGPNRKAAEQLIDMSLTKEASACIAERFNGGPSIKDVVLKPEIARLMPWGKDGSVADLVMPDWNEINARRAEMTALFEAQVARK